MGITTLLGGTGSLWGANFFFFLGEGSGVLSCPGMPTRWWLSPGMGRDLEIYVIAIPSLPSPQNHAGRVPSEWGPRRVPPSPSLNGEGDANSKPAPEEATPAAGCPSELIPAASISLLLLCCPLCPPSRAAVSLLFFTEHPACAAGTSFSSLKGSCTCWWGRQDGERWGRGGGGGGGTRTMEGLAEGYRAQREDGEAEERGAACPPPGGRGLIPAAAGAAHTEPCPVCVCLCLAWCAWVRLCRVCVRGWVSLVFTESLASAKEENVGIHQVLDQTLLELNNL